MEGNPWSLDNYLIGNNQPVASQEETMRAMEARYVMEIEQLKHQHVSWMYEMQRNAEQHVERIQQEFREEMDRLKEVHLQEFMQIQQDSHYELSKLKNQYVSEVNSLKEEVEVLRMKLEDQVLQEKKAIIPLKDEIDKLREELNQVSTSYRETKLAREQSLADLRNLGAKYKDSLEQQSLLQEEIASLTTLLDKRAEELRKVQVVEPTSRNEPIYSNAPLDTLSVSDTREIDSGSQYDSVTSDLDPFEEQLRSGVIVDPRLTLAQELADADRVNAKVIHVNSGKLKNSSQEGGSSYSKHKYPLKPFDGTSKALASEWLNHFDKIAEYHEWDESAKVKEFKMAMFGSADSWLRSLNNVDRNSFTRLLQQFQAQFGGSDAAKMDQAIYALEHIKQGKESMVTFAPRIHNLITTVVTDNNERTKLYHFYRAINPTVFKELKPSRPVNLNAAIEYCLDLERTFQPNHSSSGVPTKVSGYSSNPSPSILTPSAPTDVVDDPMEDIQQNAQRFKFNRNRGGHSNGSSGNSGSSYKKKDSYKRECFLCKKTGHIIKDCNYLKQASDSLQNSRGRKSHHSNSQKITVATNQESSSNKKINNVDIDFINNPYFSMFDSIHQNSQNVNSASMPQLKGGGAEDSDAVKFVMQVMVNEQATEALMDTGAMVSTVTLEEAMILNLPLVDAPTVIITYGNNSHGISNKKAWLELEVPGIKNNGFYVRVVPDQNYQIILGNDWFNLYDISLNPLHKFIYQIDHEKLVDFLNVNTNSISKVSNEVLESVPEEVQEILIRMPTLYDETEVQTLTTAPVVHRIETGDANPVVSRGRRFSPKENEVIDMEVKKMLAKNIIRPSKSPWCAQPVVVPKPDGSSRFCSNFRALNRVTIKDKYPLPRMEDLIDRLNGAYWFNAVDLKSAYFQLPILEEHKEKTAFATRQGLFEFNVMAQGLSNSPPTFCRFMDSILEPVSSFTIVYLDDILCFAKTKEESIIQLKKVLEILNHWNMKISLAKCQFLCQQIKFLGFIISGSGVKSNPDKVDPIKRWPTPTNLNELQRFLGICTFYHKFIRGLAELAAPLYKLLKKDVDWHWNSECKKSFVSLKRELTNLPELAYPDSNLPYDMHCDASNVALGIVLVQGGRPVAYASRTLSPAEKNYSTTERECLAVFWGLVYMHCYVHGATLVIHTDHAALKALLSTKEPKGRIARWIIGIWNYEFTIVHRKGVDNTDADSLSRLEIEPRVTHIATQEVLPDLATAQKEDRFIQEVLENIDKKPDFSLVNGILCYIAVNPPVVVIPNSWRAKFLREIHTSMVGGGHQGRDKTVAKAQENGYWKGMTEDVKSYVASCIDCKKFKAPTHKYKTLKSIEVTGPCVVWAADIAFLPVTPSGNRYLLVFMEYLTKWVITTPLASLDTDSVANVLLYQIVLIHGTPVRFITDNGTNLISEAMQVICTRLGIKKVQTSVEHPESDGLVERMNRTMKTALSIYCQNTPDLWDRYLPFVTFSINTSKQKSTGFSPFEAMYGRKARLPTLQEFQLTSPKTYSSESWITYLNHYIPLIHQEMHVNIQKSQQQQQHYFNRNRKTKESFAEGDRVLKIKMKDNWKFAEPKFSGPWKIVKITNEDKSAFILEDVSEDKRKRNHKIKRTTTANIRDIYKV